MKTIAFLLSLFLCFSASSQVASLKLSEIRADSLPPLTGAEYVEITGIAGTPLDGISIVVVGRHELLNEWGIVRAIVPLSGVIPADRAYLVVTSSVIFEENIDLLADCGLGDAQNLSIFLAQNVSGDLVAGYTDLDADNDGVLDSVPWTTLDAVTFVDYLDQPSYCLPEVFGNGGLFVFGAKQCLTYGTWSLLPFTYEGANETPGTLNPSCVFTLCYADLNANGFIDNADISIVLGSWGDYDGVGDVTQNGIVDASDLATIIGNWGPCNN